MVLVLGMIFPYCSCEFWTLFQIIWICSPGVADSAPESHGAAEQRANPE